MVSGAVSLVWEAALGKLQTSKQEEKGREGGDHEAGLVWSVGIGSGFPSLSLSLLNKSNINPPIK